MPSAAASGTSPTAAQPRTSAASTSSMAWSHARPVTASAAPPRAKTPDQTASEGEEDGLTVALEPDVEAVAALAVGAREQRVPSRRGDGGQNGIGGVRLLLVGEVDPRDAAVEQTAREDGDVEVRRLEGAVGGGHAVGLAGPDLP